MSLLQLDVDVGLVTRRSWNSSLGDSNNSAVAGKRGERQGLNKGFKERVSH